ncbi:hypothetical protein QBC38DRAFT_505706 [Podospora fimiseda]|uniref:Uncharacterized protein n=1 Tax=Podospora fimiseda TaxID=252190 RepID=A0AAN6YJK0_9PEZI|nr:hypothetical protein QBC38DRAFT_505706 [Podospora fimiseda]
MSSFSIKTILFAAATLAPFARADTQWVDADMKKLKDEDRHERFKGLQFLGSRGPHGGLNGLPVVQSFKHPVPSGKIPFRCLDFAKEKVEGTNQPHCNMDQLEVFEVEYTDCPGRSIPICRCKNAPMTIEKIAEEFSKVSPKARQWMKSISARPGGSCSASASGDHMFFNGDCGGDGAVYLHEVGHALDCAALKDDNGDGKKCMSDKDLWRQAVIEEDTCVPDNYAKNVWGDNFAQFSVMAAYHHRVQDIYESFAGDGGLECLRNGLNLAIEMTRNIFAREYQTCDEHSGFDDKAKEYVCTTSEARAQGHCDGIPDLPAPGADNAETLVSTELFGMSQRDLEIFRGDMAHVWETTPVRKGVAFFA